MKKIIICLGLLLGISLMPAQAADTAEIGMHHTVTYGYYINQSGEVRTWNGAIIPLPGRAVDISSSGIFRSIGAVLEDGSLYTWGKNESGQLGLGDKTDREAPTKVTGISNVVSISMGPSQSAALTSDGSVYTWGYMYKCDDANYNPVYEEVSKPRRVKEISNAVAVNGYGGFSVICRDGSLYNWGGDAGDNGYGELRNTAKPVKINLPPVQAVTRGHSATAIVTQDGKLYTCGEGNGSLGRHTGEAAASSPGLLDIEPVKSVCLGQWNYGAAITNNGAIYQWGSTRRNSKEPSPETDCDTPELLDDSRDFVQVSLGEGVSAGITSDGKLCTWGWGAGEELALGGGYAFYQRTFPLVDQTDAMVPGTLPAGTLDNLSAKQRTYTAFTDVDENAWYGANKTRTIAEAYELSLVDGTGKNKFSPEQPLKISEAIRLVCTLQGRYSGGNGIYTGSSPWYQPYVHHAITTGICQIGDFSDYTANATRAQMAYLFARSLPEKEITSVSQNIQIPDVTDTTPYAKEIRQLYQAGVLAGIDTTGAFAPDRTITRAEATAIFLRLVLPKQRIIPENTGSSEPPAENKPESQPDTSPENKPEQETPPSEEPLIAGTWEVVQNGATQQAVRKINGEIVAKSTIDADKVFVIAGENGIFAQKDNALFYLNPETLQAEKITDIPPNEESVYGSLYYCEVFGGYKGTVLIGMNNGYPPSTLGLSPPPATLYTWYANTGLQSTDIDFYPGINPMTPITVLGDQVLYAAGAYGVVALSADGKVTDLPADAVAMKYIDHTLYLISGNGSDTKLRPPVPGDYNTQGGSMVRKYKDGTMRTIFILDGSLVRFDELLSAEGNTVTVRGSLHWNDQPENEIWYLTFRGTGSDAKLIQVDGPSHTPDNLNGFNTKEEIDAWWNVQKDITSD